MPLIKQSGNLLLIELANASPVYPKPKIKTLLGIPLVDSILGVANISGFATNEFVHVNSVSKKRVNVKKLETLPTRNMLLINLIVQSLNQLELHFYFHVGKRKEKYDMMICPEITS